MHSALLEIYTFLANLLIKYRGHIHCIILSKAGTDEYLSLKLAFLPSSFLSFNLYAAL